MSAPNIELSIVVPAYNEEDNLRPLHGAIQAALADMDLTHEILIVDDGSKDRTWEVMQELRRVDPCVRPIKLRFNSGETAAGEAGMRNARGRYVVTMDADLQNDPADLPLLLETIRGGQWDMVCGSRIHN